MQVTILGSGSAYGTPESGNRWGKCDPHNPKNNRLTPSILVQTKGQKIIFDATPDFRHQTCAYNITDLDALIFTHGHADHILGFYAVPRFAQVTGRPLDVYCSAETFAELRRVFHYLFTPDHKLPVTWHIIKPEQSFFVADVAITPFEQLHTPAMNSLGFRIGNFVYSTDIAGFPAASRAYLKGIDLWILESNNHEATPNGHNNIMQALAWVQEFQPKRTVLTHLSTRIDYNTISSLLPPEVVLAYDGMVLTVDTVT